MIWKFFIVLFLGACTHRTKKIPLVIDDPIPRNSKIKIDKTKKIMSEECYKFVLGFRIQDNSSHRLVGPGDISASDPYINFLINEAYKNSGIKSRIWGVAELEYTRKVFLSFFYDSYCNSIEGFPVYLSN